MTIWYKTDDKTGIYKLKMIAKIPHPVSVVDDVLFIHELRMVWDTVISDIKELEVHNENAVTLHVSTELRDRRRD